MTEIPPEVILPLPNLQRSALRSLMNAAPPGYTLVALLDLVLTKGLAAVMKGRELPISEEMAERAQASLPSGKSKVVKVPRVAADYVGFSIEPHQQAALEALEGRFPLADEDELLRILLDVALRALPHDALARTRLDAATVTVQPSEGSPS